MSVFVKGQTHSAVHSMKAMQAQRRGEGIRNQFTLSAVHLYAQIVVGLAFYLYRHVSTPGYMSVLLLLPPLAAGYALSLWCTRQKGWMDRLPGKAASGCLFLCLMMDAQLSLYAFTEMVREMLPDYNSAVIALVTLLCVLPSLQKQHGHALPSLARLTKIPLIVGLGYCLVGGALQGNVDHLFPLFGLEGKRILTGSLWMLSALSAAFTPLYMHDGPQTLKQKRKGLFALFGAVGLGAATAFLSACMMPFYFLARPDTVGSQLLLSLKVNPDLTAWSVMVCLMMLLMLTSLACALSRGRHLLSHVAGEPVNAWFALLLVPLPALSTDMAQQAVMLGAPVRTGLMGAALLCLFLGSLRKKGEKH